MRDGYTRVREDKIHRKIKIVSERQKGASTIGTKKEQLIAVNLVALRSLLPWGACSTPFV